MPETRPTKHPITGCRMDTVMGEWLMEERELSRLVDMGWMIVEKGELKAYSERSQSMAEAADDKRYTLDNGIARFSISGPMTKYDTSMNSLFGGTSTKRVRETLQELRQRSGLGEVKAVFIDADSLGGTAEGTAELAAAINKTKKVMPVYVHAEDKACSACLWVATQGTKFTCGPIATVGSLGTRVTMYDTSGNGSNNYMGKPVVIDTGKFKSLGHSGLPITEEHKKEVQRIVNQLNEPFKQDVAKARDLSKTQLEEICTARIFVGADAKRVGLIDAVCTADEAYDAALKAINTSYPVRRGPGMEVPNPTAPRSTLMPTPLDRLQKLPGAKTATEDNALETAVQIAETGLVAQTRAEAQVTALQGEVTQLKTDLAAANAKLPKVMAPELLAGFLEMAEGKVDLLEKKGFVGTAQAKLLCSSLLKNPDGTPNASVFLKGADNIAMYDRVFAIFEGNKPNGLVPEKTEGQPAAKTEPGAAAGAEKPPTFEAWNEARAQANLKPDTVEQFYLRFPAAKKK